jgi:subtilisin family serine protease
MAGKWQITMRVAILSLILCLYAPAQDRYLIRIPGSAVANFARNHGLTLLNSAVNAANPRIGTIGPLAGSVQNLYLATVASGPSSQAALTSFQNDPSVQRVEADQSVSLPKGSGASAHSQTTVSSASGTVLYYGTPAWSAYVNQPAASMVQIPQAHQNVTGAGTVAFLDTGVDFTNPVLAASLNFGWDFTNNTPGGWDFGSAQTNQSTTSILDDDSILILDQSTTSILDLWGNWDPDQSNGANLNQSSTSILDQSTTSILDGKQVTNDYGHGTMIAGIIHLVAPTARLLPVKVFGDDGTSDLATILSGFYWAVGQGAKVINMSFSMSNYSAEFSSALEYAVSQGVILVASAGNDGNQVVVYPAGYSQAMAVASVNNSDQRSTFSNYGNWVAVAAPGEGVISTYPQGQYAAGWGTSFSAPFVSGAAALLVQISGKLNQSQAQQAISQAVPAGQGLGAGVLDLPLAVSYESVHH